MWIKNGFVVLVYYGSECLGLQVSVRVGVINQLIRAWTSTNVILRTP